jgi:hypothetical protein
MGRGFDDLSAAGLDLATIRALVPKMTAQIRALPGRYKDTFVQQWVQQGGQPMAVGGILTRPTMVLGGEAGVPESWIPWNSSGRSRTLLAKTASAMGYQLVSAGRYGGGHTTAPDVRPTSGYFTGQLVLDSGELLGVIKGTVKPMLKASEDRQAHRAKVGRR